MKTAFQDDEPAHLGHNVKRIREIIGFKQLDLGQRCNGWSQQQISKLENEADIDEPTLTILANGLGVTSEFIKNFKEEKAVYFIQTHNSFSDNATNSSQHNKPTITYDAADKIAHLLEKFIAEDKAKTESIAQLSKAVLYLAEEVKRLKEGK